MITEKDLQEAIAECEGARNPNANTCIKLAAFYTIRQHMFGEQPSYSFSAPPVEPETPIVSDSEFAQLIAEQDIYHVLSVVDELMDTLKVVNPKLYAGVIRRIAE